MWEKRKKAVENSRSVKVFLENSVSIFGSLSTEEIKTARSTPGILGTHYILASDAFAINSKCDFIILHLFFYILLYSF